MEILYMIRRFFTYTLIVLLVFPLFSCVKRTRGSAPKIQRAKTTTPTTPVKKKDTIFVVVPTDPQGQTFPSITPNENDFVIISSNKKLKPLIHKKNLPMPPTINFPRPSGSHTRTEYIEHFDITGKMKDLIVACDYDNPTVRNNAAALVALSSGSFNLGQICDIFDFCYTNWSYVNDPITMDYYSKASETLKNGLNGDCDDFAILLCSMIIAVGGEARINSAQDDTSGHAFSEVNIGKTNREAIKQYLIARYGVSEMQHKEDSSGNCWLNLDWQGQYPGAKYWNYNRGYCFNIIRNEMHKL